MSDDKSTDDFETYLKNKGWKYTRNPPVDNTILFLVDGYEVPNGKHFAKKIKVAFPIPIDYPTSAPYGIHTQADLDLGPNSGASILGAEWKFWSRNVSSWVIGRRNSQVYIDHVNRWLEGS
jgi:hypothetical protein